MKDDITGIHPVEQIQKTNQANTEQARMQMLQNVYGSALPMQMLMEKQILNRLERLPGLPSSKLGAEALSGRLDDFGFESYLSLPTDSEVTPPDMHSAMEQILGMDGTKPVARGIV